jgi:hypothetical protein
MTNNANEIFAKLLNGVGIGTVERNPVGSNYGSVMLPASKEWARGMSDAGSALFGSGQQCRDLSDKFSQISDKYLLHWQQMLTVVAVANFWEWEGSLNLMSAAAYVLATDGKVIDASMREIAVRAERNKKRKANESVKALASFL